MFKNYSQRDQHNRRRLIGMTQTSPIFKYFYRRHGAHCGTRRKVYKILSFPKLGKNIFPQHLMLWNGLITSEY